VSVVIPRFPRLGQHESPHPGFGGASPDRPRVLPTTEGGPRRTLRPFVSPGSDPRTDRTGRGVRLNCIETSGSHPRPIRASTARVSPQVTKRSTPATPFRGGRIVARLPATRNRQASYLHGFADHGTSSVGIRKADFHAWPISGTATCSSPPAARRRTILPSTQSRTAAHDIDDRHSRARTSNRWK
jgi:hypothetical protein